MPFMIQRLLYCICLVALPILFLLPDSSFADHKESAKGAVNIPRLSSPPTFEQFVDMSSDKIAATGMAKVEGFIQERPKDGEPASQKTEAYLGYDDKNLYVAFLCFDTEPDKVRARMT